MAYRTDAPSVSAITAATSPATRAASSHAQGGVPTGSAPSNEEDGGSAKPGALVPRLSGVNPPGT